MFNYTHTHIYMNCIWNFWGSGREHVYSLDVHIIYGGLYMVIYGK